MLGVRKDRSRKIAAVAAFAAGAAIFAFAILRGSVYSPEREIKMPGEPAFSAAVRSTLPARIIIPKIKVDAEVEEVGITFKGNMGTPKRLSDTGWYKYGTIPGELGSAVIDGHVDNGFSLPGVFADLKRLQIGDDVYVLAQDGTKLHFIVVDTEAGPYKEISTADLFTKADAPRLNLITCEGDWIPEEETDTERRVVYTRLVE
jgi:sortase (surface protein transpeptidase)